MVDKIIDKYKNIDILINNAAYYQDEPLEEKTKEQNVLFVTVEDKEEKMLSLKEKITDIEKLEMIKDNEDGTKQYKIVSKSEKDIRKALFDTLPKEGITIFELKKAETSLEDAFIKLVDNATSKTENAKGGNK